MKFDTPAGTNPIDRLHVIGQPPGAAERGEMLDAAGAHEPVERARLDALMATDHELPAIIHALDGGYVRPAPGGDLLRTTAVLPTGRNLHGFDPFRLPSAFAVQDGARQADRLLARHAADGHGVPETVAIVLWGTDNLKSEGGPIAQALWLMGTEPRFDSYGRLTGAKLLPLEALGRPRVDVVITLSGIFRDLLPLQTKLLAEAALLAASAEEDTEQNFVRKHALAYLAEHGGTMEQAALRVFGNADGAYGANVNSLVGSGTWENEDELGDAYVNQLRKCYEGRVPGGADLVTYWFEKARAQIDAGKCQRAGLVATNSIRQKRNRVVLERILQSTRIFEAWSDEDWVNEGAAVRVSIVCFGQGGAARLDGHDLRAVRELGLCDVRIGDRRHDVHSDAPVRR